MVYRLVKQLLFTVESHEIPLIPILFFLFPFSLFIYFLLSPLSLSPHHESVTHLPRAARPSSSAPPESEGGPSSSTRPRTELQFLHAGRSSSSLQGARPAMVRCLCPSSRGRGAVLPRRPLSLLMTVPQRPATARPPRCRGRAPSPPLRPLVPTRSHVRPANSARGATRRLRRISPRRCGIALHCAGLPFPARGQR